MEKQILDLIDKYSKKHSLAKECGSEYIFQDDEAQIDALKLVADIFDLYAEEAAVLPGCCNFCMKSDGKYCAADYQVLYPAGVKCPHFESRDG